MDALTTHEYNKFLAKCIKKGYVTLEQAKHDLDVIVEMEEYEAAAILRDHINNLTR